jgi:leucyl/phenylalanyl-tRNA--protein transferase
VLFPNELRISNSIKSLIKQEEFDFTINQAFPEVIRHCKEIERPGQAGTWITNEVENAFTRMHELGYAHSAEVWKNGELMGGLYGIKLGKVFFGESMFSKTSYASRYAFIKYVDALSKEGIELIDCQVHTNYLESMGAVMIPRKEFTELLESATG